LPSLHLSITVLSLCVFLRGLTALHSLHFPLSLVTHPTFDKPAPTIAYVDSHLPLLSFVSLLAESPVSVSQLLRIYVGRLCTFAVGLQGIDMVRMARLDSSVSAPLPAFIFWFQINNCSIKISELNGGGIYRAYNYHHETKLYHAY
jgi:hypothetical protein